MDTKNAKKIVAGLKKYLSALKPPEDITVTQWAEKYRYLPSSSAEPGLWRTRRTPYLRDMMDAFSDPKVRRIVFVGSSQVGKSEFELNCIGYIIDQDPGNILYIHPDDGDARKFSQMRVAPMVEASPVLRRKVAKSKSRDSSNTMLKKSFPGGMLIMCGSLVPSDLASIPARYVFGDERDRWAKSAGKEGDPWKLAMARQITFYNAKAVEVSTPTVKNASAIARSFHEGTMERWKVECPHCGEYNDIRFSDIRYDKEETVVQDKRTYSVSNIMYVCPKCACVSTEIEIKKAHAKWVAENPGAAERGIRSFWLNSFVSPWASWESTILEFLNAETVEQLQVVYNTLFGELWEHRGETADEETLLKRREEYDAELPDGVLVLTAGVDTQDDRMEYEIVGHGHWGETWGIEKGIVVGRPDDDSTWSRLDELVFDRILRFNDDIGLPVSISFVDEGGHFTQEVRQRCRERLDKKVFAIAGSNNHNAPYTAPPRKQKIVVTNHDGKKVSIGMCWRYDIGVDAGKQLIMSNLAVEKPGSKYCHFPLRDDYGPGYFKGLLSERLEYNEKKKQPWEWKKIPGHERNEALDCRNYATAAFKALPKDLDAIARRLAAARGEKTAEAVTVTAPQAQRKRAGTQKNKTVDRLLQEW